MHSTGELIDIALKDDIGCGDITTASVVSPHLTGLGDVMAKDDFVVAGLGVARSVFNQLDPTVDFSTDFKDGDFIKIGQVVFFEFIGMIAHGRWQHAGNAIYDRVEMTRFCLAD